MDLWIRVSGWERREFVRLGRFSDNLAIQCVCERIKVELLKGGKKK